MTLLTDALHRLLAHGSIEKARLTEAAAADTAAKDLLHGAVMDDLDIRDNEIVGIIGLVHIHHHALFDHRRRIVARRNSGNSAVIVIGNII